MAKLKLNKDLTVEGKKYKAGDTVNCSTYTAKYLSQIGAVDAGKKAAK